MTKDRLLVHAPRARDARVIAAQLNGAGLCASIATAAVIVQAIRTDELGAAVITDEAIADFDQTDLSAALAAQPPWSDIPFIVLTHQEFRGWTSAQLSALLGNNIILPHLLDSDVLISNARSALRGRERQRRTQVHLVAMAAGDLRERELAATLEARVADRTMALSTALAAAADSQQRLSDSEELYRHTVELTAQTPWTADVTGRVLSIGGFWANPTETVWNWEKLVHEEDLEAMLAVWATAVASGAAYQHDFRLRRADGSYRWCRSKATPRRSDDGGIARWYGTLEHIHDQRVAATKLGQLQAELIHVSRLSAMGTMASTLAHELNQPLTAIANYVRGSRRMLTGHPDYKDISEALEMADRSAVRAGEIVRRVRELVTKGEVQRLPEDLSALVREACSLAMIDARSSGIELHLDLAVTPIKVMVDRIQVQQVLLNLLRNAAEAVVGRPDRQIAVTTIFRSEECCEVTVSDTGPGIAEGCAGRLFEPFNTTKNDGMGIGLSISRTIIEAHGGVIWHRPGPAGGAVFGFTLVSDAPSATTSKRTPLATTENG